MLDRMPPSPRRRFVVASVASAAWLAAPAVWRGAIAQVPPGGAQRLTPRQTEGPFYPVTLPADSDFDLLAQGQQRYTQGQPAWLEGAVSDPAGRAVSGAAVEIWQCDQQGHYHHPGDRGADPAFQGFGRVLVGADGSYRFRTIRPAPYSGRTPHIHLKVKLGARDLLTTQVYVEGDPGNERDFLWRNLRPADRSALTVVFAPDGSDGLRARFPVVVAA